jgi:predicted XRE-type DNA-binding protein
LGPATERHGFGAITFHAETGAVITGRNNNVDGMGTWGIFTAFSDDILIEGNTASHSGFPDRQAPEPKVKADLTLRIHQQIEKLALTHTRAAERLGLSQPDVSKPMSGRHSGFSVDRLLSLLNALDVGIDIIVRPRFHPRRASRGFVRVLVAAGSSVTSQSPCDNTNMRWTYGSGDFFHITNIHNSLC